eukprot:TRINITY_DN27180_c0_g1_i1.p1 TRINITY_DN27180_c0_g1~~TRINITY_DN27180_c0_g1_i1.p1  ORF type:complete len:830 (+),score=190.95 TRINITY_DN27180_c0_g1_i1:61-2550(+)
MPAELPGVGERVSVKAPPQPSGVSHGVDEYVKGFVRFAGPVEFAAGEWVGVELDDFRGKNDGSVKGVRYFECEPEKGLFTRAAALKRLDLHDEDDEHSRALPFRRHSSACHGTTPPISPQTRTVSKGAGNEAHRSSMTKAAAPAGAANQEESRRHSVAGASHRPLAKHNSNNSKPKSPAAASVAAPPPAAASTLQAKGQLHLEKEEFKSQQTLLEEKRQSADGPTVDTEAALSKYVRQQLAAATEEHDSELIRKLMPKARELGVCEKELANAERVLEFQVQKQELQRPQRSEANQAQVMELLERLQCRIELVEQKQTGTCAKLVPSTASQPAQPLVDSITSEAAARATVEASWKTRLDASLGQAKAHFMAIQTLQIRMQAARQAAQQRASDALATGALDTAAAAEQHSAHERTKQASDCEHEDGLREVQAPDGSKVLECDMCGLQVDRQMVARAEVASSASQGAQMRFSGALSMLSRITEADGQEEEESEQVMECPQERSGDINEESRNDKEAGSKVDGGAAQLGTKPSTCNELDLRLAEIMSKIDEKVSTSLQLMKQHVETCVKSAVSIEIDRYRAEASRQPLLSATMPTSGSEVRAIISQPDRMLASGECKNAAARGKPALQEWDQENARANSHVQAAPGVHQDRQTSHFQPTERVEAATVRIQAAQRGRSVRERGGALIAASLPREEEREARALLETIIHSRSRIEAALRGAAPLAPSHGAPGASSGVSHPGCGSAIANSVAPGRRRSSLLSATDVRCEHPDGFRTEILSDGSEVNICDTCGAELQAADIIAVTECLHEDGFRETAKGVLVCDGCGVQVMAGSGRP